MIISLYANTNDNPPSSPLTTKILSKLNMSLIIRCINSRSSSLYRLNKILIRKIWKNKFIPSISVHVISIAPHHQVNMVSIFVVRQP